MKSITVPAQGVEEVWKRVPQTVKLLVSNLGRVKSDVPRGRAWQGAWCKTRYRVRYDHQNFNVGTLVLEAFVAPRPSEDHRVWYLNGLRRDNRASNLTWIHKDNFVKRERTDRKKGEPKDG